MDVLRWDTIIVAVIFIIRENMVQQMNVPDRRRDRNQPEPAVHCAEGREEKNEDSSDESVFYAVHSLPRALNQLKATVHIGNSPIEFLVDTGASINILTKEDHESLKPRPATIPNNENIYAFGSRRPLKMMGKFTADVTFKGKPCNLEFYVLTAEEKQTHSLLSCSGSIEMRMIHVSNDLLTHNEQIDPQLNAKISRIPIPKRTPAPLLFQRTFKTNFPEIQTVKSDDYAARQSIVAVKKKLTVKASCKQTGEVTTTAQRKQSGNKVRKLKVGVPVQLNGLRNVQSSYLPKHITSMNIVKRKEGQDVTRNLFFHEPTCIPGVNNGPRQPELQWYNPRFRKKV